MRRFTKGVFSTVAILGPGLLGASAGAAIFQNQIAERIVAWARKPETRLLCEQAEWCDEVFESAAEAASEADFIIICTPVHTILPILDSISKSLQPDTIVTDVGSTKSLIVRLARGVPPAHAHFVGSHPMAGSEKSGFSAAHSDLFENRACFVTPLTDTPAAPVDTVVRFWNALGMLVDTVSPEEHDEIVANISHLPHVLASALCSYLDTRPHTWRDFAGGGLRDTTRVAAGDPGLWKDIVEQNADEIVRALRGFQAELHTLESAIINKQTSGILSILERGQHYRARLNSNTSNHDSA